MAAKTLGIGAAALALIALLSYLSARTTLYVVTSRRIVMKIGVALPIFINIPFKQIVSASTCAHGDGTGDIPVRLTSSARIGYFVLWPHARPFHFANPEPSLRSVANVAAVAETLSRALREAAGQPEGAIAREIIVAGRLARGRCRASETSDGVRREFNERCCYQAPPRRNAKGGLARRRRADCPDCDRRDHSATDRLRQDPRAQWASRPNPFPSL